MYRILIVEDDSTIAEALKRHLEGWDHETVIAEDFKNIMAEFTRVEPYLVLLDIGLPFTTYFTGAARYGRFRMCRSFLSPLPATI